MAEFVKFLDDQDLPNPARVLDIGSLDVQGSYRQHFDGDRWEYVGLDVTSGPGVDVVVKRPYRWSSIPAGSFDVVISGQAFEHLEFPWVTIHEIRRLMKPGGWLCLIVPSAGHYHPYPVDCWRIYVDGLGALARWADLHVVRAEMHTEPEGWEDDSDEWQDSVLVARRPIERRAVLSGLKHGVLRSVLRMQAERRTGLTAEVTTVT